ncbi:MAG TPA: hypothetical protein VK699_02970 [Terriglobales bacterium]|nr:hypothetical protein [Terriglobales bacterium]
MRFKAMLLCSFLSLMIPAVSFAGGSTCSTATAVIPDGRSLELDYAPPSSTVWYQFTVTTNHSYSVEVRDDLDPDNADFTPANGGNVLFYAAPVNCSSPVFSANYTDTHLMEPVAGPHATRFSFVPNTTGAYYVSVQNGSNVSGHYATVTVAETTLYTPAYNSVSPFTMYYSLSNTTSFNLTYVMAVFDTGGNQISTSGATLLNAHNASYINSASGFLATNNYGTLILTHNGPPGAIQVEATARWTDSGTVVYRDIPFGPIRQRR